MDIGLRLPHGNLDLAALAARAERLGYASIWASEVFDEDAFVTLASVAAATERVAVGTAIVNVYSRTPAVLALAAATLDDVSDGRARLGLGTSTARAVETLHGQAYDRPVRRTHEAAAIVSRLLGGDEPVSYDGELLSVSEVPPLDADVPLYNAALGPANRRVTGRLFDGWIPHNIPFPALGDAFDIVADAAREAGRDPADLRVSPYVPTAVAEDEAAARELLREHVAYYVGSGEGYRRAVAEHFPETAEAVAERWNAGDRDAARAAVTDEMAAALGVAGTPGTAGERFRATVDRPVIDEPQLVIAGRPSAERARRTVEAVAPDG
ncbi:MAG: LLM class flavin-dependent oxidoreductase [Halobacteriales archaeon]